MSSSETPFRVPVAIDVETFIVGRSYELVQRAVGPFSGALAPGIYKFNFRRGTASSEQLVEIPPGRTEPVVVVPAEELELDTPLPLAKSKRSDTRQVLAAREMSRRPQIHAGHGSGIYLFVRNDASAPPRDPAAGFSLHALDDSLVADIAQVAVRDDTHQPTYAAFNIGVDPGAYRLRYHDGEDTLEQIVIATAGWQTQVFLLHRAPSPDGTTAAETHPLANASVLLSHGEFDPDNELIELADAARIALSLGRARMPRDLMSKLLEDKFESPMLGIYAAHAMAASGSRDSMLERVLSVLEMTIPHHSDVAALRLATSSDIEIETPPMLRSSWNAIVDATQDGKASIRPGSLASRLPTSFVADTPWLVWSVDALLPAHEAAASHDIKADLDEIQYALDTMADLPGKLTGWEEAIYSYLQRRADYGRDERARRASTIAAMFELDTSYELGELERWQLRARVLRDSPHMLSFPDRDRLALDDHAIARAFGITVNHVQATVAGLAAKLRMKRPARPNSSRGSRAKLGDAMNSYKNFDLRIQADGDRFVTSADWGTQAAKEPFELDSSLEWDLGEIERLGPKTLRKRGSALFDALIRGRVRDLYHQARGQIGSDLHKGVRIRILLDSRDQRLRPIVRLPWEILFDQSADATRFLALDSRRPIVRTIDSVEQPVILTPGPLKRVLLALASPTDSVYLDLDRDCAGVEAALGRIAIQPAIVPHTTRTELLKAIRDDAPQVVHFMGHGRFDTVSGQGVLLLEDERGNEDPLSASTLATFFAGRSVPQLVILASCLSAEPGSDPAAGPFGGVAAALVAAGVPAVLAMQGNVRDESAIQFTERLYRRIVAGDPIEVAVSEARTALYAGRAETLDWAAPVLFVSK